MKGMKKTFLIMAGLVFCVPLSGLAGSTALRLSLDPVYDTNVYKDNSQLSDTGIMWDFGLNYYARIKNTYPRILYKFSGINFFKYDYENYYTHSLIGTVLQRTGRFITFGLESGINTYQYKFTTQYDSAMLSGMPLVRIYPSFFTELEIGYSIQATEFPNYDLDNNGADMRAQLTQELFWDTTLIISGSSGRRNYSDRYLYETSVTSEPVPTSQLRLDNETIIIAKIKRRFEGIGSFELGYYGNVLDSNANEFNWGPLQDELTNVPGDERIINNYWSNSINRINILYQTGNKQVLFMEFFAQLQNQEFSGWLARDENENILSPAEYRKDVQFIGSIKAEKLIWKNVSITSRYTYERNNSNDLPYDYNAQSISVGAALTF